MAKNRKNPTIGKAVAELWLAVTSQFFDGYRPERHYMRGPGPKWRAKHAQPNVRSEPDLGGVMKIAA
jgi:hypothetical protein